MVRIIHEEARFVKKKKKILCLWHRNISKGPFHGEGEPSQSQVKAKSEVGVKYVLAQVKPNSQ